MALTEQYYYTYSTMKREILLKQDFLEAGSGDFLQALGPLGVATAAAHV